MLADVARPCAFVFLRTADRVVVAELSDDDEGTFYRPPGGGIDFGERAADAAVREMREEFGIQLTEVRPMEEIYLTGVYPGGEGAVVQVQRFESGKWEDFPVDASVSGETFSTYVQTAQRGVNTFRVRDTSGPDVSNEVKVKIH